MTKPARLGFEVDEVHDFFAFGVVAFVSNETTTTFRLCFFLVANSSSTLRTLSGKRRWTDWRDGAGASLLRGRAMGISFLYVELYYTTLHRSVNQ